MDLLGGYSSSEEEEEKVEEERKEKKESFQDTQDHSPNIEYINIFSQNYSNQINMSTCFLYMPWNPSLSTINTLKAISNKTVRHLMEKKPKIMNSYNWKDLHNSSLNYHISLCPNIIGKSYKINQFIENLSIGLRKTEISPDLIGFDNDEINRINNLNSLLFKNKEDDSIKYKKYINLKLNPNLNFFKSITTKNMFLACDIDLSESPDSKGFFNSLNSLIDENLSLLELKKSDNMEVAYHISIKVGESKNFSQISDSELSELIEEVDKLNFSNELKTINVNINEIVIYQLNKDKKFTSIPFNI